MGREQSKPGRSDACAKSLKALDVADICYSGISTDVLNQNFSTARHNLQRSHACKRAQAAARRPAFPTACLFNTEEERED
eukprot:3732437-Pleurochrysis_carterae.AAC.1